MGNRYTSYLDEDRTTGTADIGVRITRNNLSGTLRYNGEYGNHFTSHIIWADILFHPGQPATRRLYPQKGRRHPRPASR